MTLLLGWKDLTRDQRGAVLGGIGLLIACAALAWHSVPGNIGHHDTAYYLDGARQLARGNGFVSAESSPSGEKLDIANWPPGFSLMMVPGLWVGLSVHQSAALALGGSYVGLLAAIYSLLLMGSRIRNWPVALAVCAVFGLTPSLLEMQDRLLSDLPMSAALMVAVAATVATLQLGDRWRAGRLSFLIAGALGALFAWVVFIRYAGMFAVAGLVSSMGLLVGLKRIRDFWKQGVVLLGTTVFLVGGWMLRNSILTGEAMGQRGSRMTDPALHVERAVGGVLLWATDVRDFLGKESSSWLAFSLLQFALLFLLSVEAASGRLKRNTAAAVLGFTATAYTAGLILSASMHPFNSLLHPRYWVFVWAALLWMSLLLVVHAKTRFKWILRASFALSLATCFITGYSQYGERHAASVTPSRTRAAPVHEIADEMRKKDCHIVSNDNRVLLVNDAYDELYRFPNSKSAFKKLQKRGPICVVWIKPKVSSRTRVAGKQMKLLEWAEKKKFVHLDRKKRSYEVWLPGPS